jgi:hypothetical protein
VLEDVSLGFWILSCCLALALAIRSSCLTSRHMALWTGWVAVLAALRELDLQVWLNPQHLGALGVRYRLDWWMSGKVSLWLRLGWALGFLAVGFLAIYWPVKHRRLLWRLAREGELFTGLLVLAVGFLCIGYVMDDILRPVRFASAGTKQLIEETSEMIGAGLYCLGMVFQWRMTLRANK